MKLTSWVEVTFSIARIYFRVSEWVYYISIIWTKCTPVVMSVGHQSAQEASSSIGFLITADRLDASLHLYFPLCIQFSSYVYIHISILQPGFIYLIFIYPNFGFFLSFSMLLLRMNDTDYISQEFVFELYTIHFWFNSLLFYKFFTLKF